jgi:hypothetical protein
MYVNHSYPPAPSPVPPHQSLPFTLMPHYYFQLLLRLRFYISVKTYNIVFLSLANLTQHDVLQFHPFSCKWHNFILLYISWPARAHPRTLTGRNGRLRKDKRQKTNIQKAGVKWAGHSDGDTQQPHSPPASLLYIVANRKVEQQFSGGHDTVVIGRKNPQSLFSGRKPLSKTAMLHFALTPSATEGCAHPSLQIIGHSCAHSSLQLGAMPTQPANYLT